MEEDTHDHSLDPEHDEVSQVQDTSRKRQRSPEPTSSLSIMPSRVSEVPNPYLIMLNAASPAPIASPEDADNDASTIVVATL
jgi:hypothetical protein